MTWRPCNTAATSQTPTLHLKEISFAACVKSQDATGKDLHWLTMDCCATRISMLMVKFLIIGIMKTSDCSKAGNESLQ